MNSVLSNIFAFITSLFIAQQQPVTYPVISIPNIGAVKGSVFKTLHGNEFWAFRGIPFAEPPIGKLRFERPVAKAPWINTNKTFDATKDGSACAQIPNPLYNLGKSKEDCLFINVYTRNYTGSDSANRAVMVFFHGGSFQIGEGGTRWLQAGRILDNNVVLVTANFRQGIFGFFSTGNEAASGNYAFFDQVLALQWVKNNIHAFGGDNDKITIWGVSSGAMSASLHILSPVSKGLFNRAILMSGSALLGAQFNPNPLDGAKKIAKRVRCPVENAAEMVDCLREKPADELLSQTDKLQKEQNPKGIYFYFLPTVDGEFLTDTPLKLLRDGNIPKVPTVIGLTSAEGFLDYSLFRIMNGLKEPELPTLLSTILNIPITEPKLKNVTKVVRKEYFDEINMRNSTAVKYATIQLITDCIFAAGNSEVLTDLIKVGFTPYLYSFDYLNDRVLLLNWIAHTLFNFYGVAHGEDQFIYFGDSGNPNYIDPVAERFIQLWINFAEYGNPTARGNLSSWPPAEGGNSWQIPQFHINKKFSISKFNASGYAPRKFWMDDVPAIIASA